MADLTNLNAILDQYPMYQFLLGDPEVGPLLVRAVDPATPFSQTRFEAEVARTSWYRNRSAAQRAWEILEASDPGEANRRRSAMYGQVSDLSTRLGANLSGPELLYMTNYNLGFGIEPGSPEFNLGLRNFLQSQSPTRMVLGSISGNMNNITQTAKQDWFFEMPENEAYGQAVDLALGYTDENALRQRYQQYANSKYPWLAPLMNEGKSMRDIFASQISTLAEEWEMDPADISYTMPTLQQVLGRRDMETQEMRPATIYEAKVLARRDDNFYKTSKWSQLDSNMTNTLLQTFGKRAA